jgi:hypothetical protein
MKKAFSSCQNSIIISIVRVGMIEMKTTFQVTSQSHSHLNRPVRVIEMKAPVPFTVKSHYHLNRLGRNN